MSADTPTSNKSGNTYALRALAGEVEVVRAATPGNRNNTLNTAGVKLGNLVASGALERAQVESELTEAALSTGLPQDEIRATLRSAIEAGMRRPRGAPERAKRKPPEAKQGCPAHALVQSD